MLLWLLYNSVRPSRNGIPDYKNAPPPPPEPERWYPVDSHDLVEKTIYRHRVTGLNVWVVRAGSKGVEGQCSQNALGFMWNTVKGEWMDQSFSDNELETDDINLAPRAKAAHEERMRIIARTEVLLP